VTFDAHADADRHCQLAFDGPVATLAMAVAEDVTLQPGYKLKP
jgi:benzoyl-CoA-dihydrodiol lyase